MKKLYHQRLNAGTREDIRRAEKFNMFLLENNINYVVFEKDNNYLFGCWLNEAEKKKCITALNKIVFFDAIEEVHS